ncbi:MAG: short-chain dehydrogenase [Alphaproteobacteria bacterium]|nr:MAG: short-chain dehydrogenase [Alphaproteobacteria bacterium]
MLSGKRIIVTGGARGLGRSFAEGIARQGAHVVIADILEEQGHAVAVDLRADGLNVEFYPLDLAAPDSVENCVEQAVKSLGGLDGLINNGAIATGIGGKSMEEIDVETWDRVMTVNVRGTWLMTRSSSPHLRASKAGRVVNVASDTALWGAPMLMHYVSSKGAVISMSRAMAREMGTDNVTVNVIAPGLTLCEATEYVPEERHRLYMEGRAINREQYPEDIVGAVSFLLSDSAGFLTGQVLPVNGGFVMN